MKTFLEKTFHAAVVCVLAILPLSTQSSFAQEIPLSYRVITVDDPLAIQIWGQELLNRAGEETFVRIAEPRIIKGSLIVSQIIGPLHCGNISCPLRAVKNNEVIDFGMTCDFGDQHSVTPSGGILATCDELHQLENKE